MNRSLSRTAGQIGPFLRAEPTRDKKAKPMRNLACLLSLVMGLGCHQARGPESTAREQEIQKRIHSLKIGSITSYYVFSNLPLGSTVEKLPAIIFIGHSSSRA